MSSCTPAGWYSDELIHKKTTRDCLLNTVINKEKKSTLVAGRKKNNKKRGQSIVDVSELAHAAWRNRFGDDLLIAFTTLSVRGRHMHMAHCSGIYQNIHDAKTSKWIFPIYAESIENGSMCFPKIKIAKHAFLWHVLVHVATQDWRRRWFRNMMHTDGDNGSLVLIERLRSNPLIKLVLKGNIYYFRDIGGNDELACCRESVSNLYEEHN